MDIWKSSEVEYFRKKYTPVIMVQSTDGAEAIARKNGLQVSDLIRPFSFLKDISIPFRTTAEKPPHNVTKFSARIVHSNDLGLPSLDSVDPYLHRIVQSDPTSLNPNAVQNEPILSSLEDALEWYGRALKSPDGATPWFDKWHRGVIRTLRGAPVDTIDSPIAIFIVASTVDPNPVQLLNKLYAQSSLPPQFAHQYDPDIPRFLILLHDVQSSSTGKFSFTNEAAVSSFSAQLSTPSNAPKSPLFAKDAPQPSAFVSKFHNSPVSDPNVVLRELHMNYAPSIVALIPINSDDNGSGCQSPELSKLFEVEEPLSVWPVDLPRVSASFSDASSAVPEHPLSESTPNVLSNGLPFKSVADALIRCAVVPRRGCCLSSKDISALKSGIGGLLKVLMPSLEARMFALATAVFRIRGGLRNKMMSWLGSSSGNSKSPMPSTYPLCLTAENPFPHQPVMFGSEEALVGDVLLVPYANLSTEKMTRLLGELCIAIGDFDTAAALLRFSRDDCTRDKLPSHAAAASEALAASLILGAAGDSASPLMNTSLREALTCLENSFSSYARASHVLSLRLRSANIPLQSNSLYANPQPLSMHSSSREGSEASRQLGLNPLSSMGVAYHPSSAQALQLVARKLCTRLAVRAAAAHALLAVGIARTVPPIGDPQQMRTAPLSSSSSLSLSLMNASALVKEGQSALQRASDLTLDADVLAAALLSEQVALCMLKAFPAMHRGAGALWCRAGELFAKCQLPSAAARSLSAAASALHTDPQTLAGFQRTDIARTASKNNFPRMSGGVSSSAVSLTDEVGQIPVEGLVLSPLSPSAGVGAAMLTASPWTLALNYDLFRLSQQQLQMQQHELAVHSILTILSSIHSPMLSGGGIARTQRNLARDLQRAFGVWMDVFARGMLSSSKKSIIEGSVIDRRANLLNALDKTVVLRQQRLVQVMDNSVTVVSFDNSLSAAVALAQLGLEIPGVSKLIELVLGGSKHLMETLKSVVGRSPVQMNSNNISNINNNDQSNISPVDAFSMLMLSIGSGDGAVPQESLWAGVHANEGLPRAEGVSTLVGGGFPSWQRFHDSVMRDVKLNERYSIFDGPKPLFASSVLGRSDSIDRSGILVAPHFKCLSAKSEEFSWTSVCSETAAALEDSLEAAVKAMPPTRFTAGTSKDQMVFTTLFGGKESEDFSVHPLFPVLQFDGSTSAPLLRKALLFSVSSAQSAISGADVNQLESHLEWFERDLELASSGEWEAQDPFRTIGFNGITRVRTPVPLESFRLRNDFINIFGDAAPLSTTPIPSSASALGSYVATDLMSTVPVHALPGGPAVARAASFHHWATSTLKGSASSALAASPTVRELLLTGRGLLADLGGLSAGMPRPPLHHQASHLLQVPPRHPFEPIMVSFTLCNTLSVEVPVRSIRPIIIVEGEEAEILSSSSIDLEQPDIEKFSFIAPPATLLLLPRESRTVTLPIIPLRPLQSASNTQGTAIVKGVRFILLENVRCEHNFSLEGPLLTDSRPQRANRARAPDNRLTLKVIPSIFAAPSESEKMNICGGSVAVSFRFPNHLTRSRHISLLSPPLGPYLPLPLSASAVLEGPDGFESVHTLLRRIIPSSDAGADASTEVKLGEQLQIQHGALLSHFESSTTENFATAFPPQTDISPVYAFPLSHSSSSNSGPVAAAPPLALQRHPSQATLEVLEGERFVVDVTITALVGPISQVVFCARSGGLVTLAPLADVPVDGLDASCIRLPINFPFSSLEESAGFFHVLNENGDRISQEQLRNYGHTLQKGHTGVWKLQARANAAGSLVLRALIYTASPSVFAPSFAPDFFTPIPAKQFAAFHATRWVARINSYPSLALAARVAPTHSIASSSNIANLEYDVTVAVTSADESLSTSLTGVRCESAVWSLELMSVETVSSLLPHEFFSSSSTTSVDKEGDSRSLAALGSPVPAGNTLLLRLRLRRRTQPAQWQLTSLPPPPLKAPQLSLTQPQSVTVLQEVASASEAPKDAPAADRLFRTFLAQRSIQQALLKARSKEHDRRRAAESSNAMPMTLRAIREAKRLEMLRDCASNPDPFAGFVSTSTSIVESGKGEQEEEESFPSTPLFYHLPSAPADVVPSDPRFALLSTNTVHFVIDYESSGAEGSGVLGEIRRGSLFIPSVPLGPARVSLTAGSLPSHLASNGGFLISSIDFNASSTSTSTTITTTAGSNNPFSPKTSGPSLSQTPMGASSKNLLHTSSSHSLISAGSSSSTVAAAVESPTLPPAGSSITGSKDLQKQLMHASGGPAAPSRPASTSSINSLRQTSSSSGTPLKQKVSARGLLSMLTPTKQSQQAGSVIGPQQGAAAAPVHPLGHRTAHALRYYSPPLSMNTSLSGGSIPPGVRLMGPGDPSRKAFVFSTAPSLEDVLATLPLTATLSNVDSVVRAKANSEGVNGLREYDPISVSLVITHVGGGGSSIGSTPTTAHPVSFTVHCSPLDHQFLKVMGKTSRLVPSLRAGESVTLQFKLLPLDAGVFDLNDLFWASALRISLESGVGVATPVSKATLSGNLIPVRNIFSLEENVDIRLIRHQQLVSIE